MTTPTKLEEALDEVVRISIAHARGRMGDHRITAARAAVLAVVRELAGTVDVAIDLAEEGWGYASAYFQEKWDYAARVKELRETVAALVPRKEG